MKFTIGSIVFLLSLLLLAILARISSVNPGAPVLRGEILPALLAVLISTGLTVGLMMMVLGGESYFASRAIELAVIAVFAIASVWIIVKLVARAPGRLAA